MRNFKTRASGYSGKFQTVAALRPLGEPYGLGTFPLKIIGKGSTARVLRMGR
jgi:hypothetical protein